MKLSEVRDLYHRVRAMLRARHVLRLNPTILGIQFEIDAAPTSYYEQLTELDRALDRDDWEDASRRAEAMTEQWGLQREVVSCIGLMPPEYQP